MPKFTEFQNKHFLFDYDGVISQSPYILFESWCSAFRKIANLDIGEEEYYLLEGIGVEKTVEILGSKYGVNPSSYQAIIKFKNEYFRRNYTFTVYDGVYEVVNVLKNMGARIALVTGADKHRILESVPGSFIDQFEVLITSDDIANTKPDPEPYIKAAKLLSVESKDCIVLENAPLGVQAAKAAGMFVIAFKTTLSEQCLSNADVILESIKDLLRLLKTNI